MAAATAMIKVMSGSSKFAIYLDRIKMPVDGPLRFLHKNGKDSSGNVEKAAVFSTMQDADTFAKSVSASVRQRLITDVLWSFEECCFQGRWDIVFEMNYIKRYGCPVFSNGWTPLSYAAMWCDDDCLIAVTQIASSGKIKSLKIVEHAIDVARDRVKSGLESAVLDLLTIYHSKLEQIRAANNVKQVKWG